MGLTERPASNRSELKREYGDHRRSKTAAAAKEVMVMS